MGSRSHGGLSGTGEGVWEFGDGVRSVVEAEWGVERRAGGGDERDSVGVEITVNKCCV